MNNRLIADSRLQTDGMMSPCKASFSYLVVNTPNKRSKRFFPQFCKIRPSNILFLLLDSSQRFFHPRRPTSRFSPVAYTQYVTGLNILELHVRLEVVFGICQQTYRPKNNCHVGHPVSFCGFP